MKQQEIITQCRRIYSNKLAKKYQAGKIPITGAPIGRIGNQVLILSGPTTVRRESRTLATGFGWEGVR